METIIQNHTVQYPFPISWNSSDLVSITLPSQKIIKLIPFQKQNRTWYVRFSSEETGKLILKYRKTSVPYVVRKYRGNNPLYVHGPIVRNIENRYLSHADGTPFFYLADTWWYAMTNRMTHSAMKLLLKDRQTKGFTAVQCVIGVTPEVSIFSKDTANEGGTPFLKNFQINPSYFDAVDTKIELLVEAGIVPVIFGGWGHHIDTVGVESMKLLWQEVIARYASYPVIFSLTGEADVFLHGMPDHKKGFIPHVPFLRTVARRIKHQFLQQWIFHKNQQLLSARINAWNSVGEYINKHDGFNRPLTVHPHINKRASQLFSHPAWLDIDSIQTGHHEDSVSFMRTALKEATKENVPILNLEPWYEGIFGKFDAYHQRYAFWISMLSGACGHSYGAHGLWQMADTDNFMNHWGRSDWSTAYRFAGSGEIGCAKKFLSSLPWWKITEASKFLTYKRSEKSNQLPLIASVGKKYCILYIPDIKTTRDIVVTFPDSTVSVEETWLDPATMLPLPRKGTSSRDRIVLYHQHE